MAMKMADLKNLDANNIGAWPGPLKAILILLICAGVGAAGFYVDTQDQLAALDGEKNREVNELRPTFERKQAKAANLEPLKQQLAQMKQSFGAMLRLLPNKTEIEALLVDISQSGLAAGLEFELFKPLPEQPAEFYAVQPIQIRVTGAYHEFGEFISAVAALPRIVTQHDVTIVPSSQSDETGSRSNETRLVMDMTARTYRYLEEDEIQAKKP